MACEQEIANKAVAKAVVETTRAAIQAVAAATEERSLSVTGPKIGRCTMKHPRFNWETDNKYSKHKPFRLEVNIILTRYNIPQAEQLAIVKNWLGRKGLQLIKSLTLAEKDTCSTLGGLFEILTMKFKHQFNEIIKSLKQNKLSRQNGENDAAIANRM